MAAVDGKVCRKWSDKDGASPMLLHIVGQMMKLTMSQWVMKRKKKNEVRCLQKHLGESWTADHYVQLLRGCALGAQRLLLEALHAVGCDYVCEVKENQPELLGSLMMRFREADRQRPSAHEVRKRATSLPPAS